MVDNTFYDPKLHKVLNVSKESAQEMWNFDDRVIPVWVRIKFNMLYQVVRSKRKRL